MRFLEEKPISSDRPKDPGENDPAALAKSVVCLASCGPTVAIYISEGKCIGCAACDALFYPTGKTQTSKEAPTIAAQGGARRLLQHVETEPSGRNAKKRRFGSANSRRKD